MGKYEKQTFVDRQTILGAVHLNHIEDGIVQVESDLDAAKSGMITAVDETEDSTVKSALETMLAQIEAKGKEILEQAGQTKGTAPTVYCWGDSLTQGIGGNVNGWHLISYPQVLGERCNVVNLGILSDNVPTIQARQGSLQILLPECTIPASVAESVEIGDVDDGLPLSDGTVAHLLKYGDAGLNPCYVNDVPCILFRTYKGDTTEGTKFHLRRLEDGEAISVTADTVLVPYSAKHYRGGIHIFWMGANGGYGNKTDSGTDLAFSDYVARLQACVKASQADDYLIIYARERVGYTTDEDGEKQVLAQTFAGHFIDLVPQLCDRGLLYGETSLWDGTLKNGIPAVLDSGDGCHFSFYGYKAIAGIVWEYLCPKLMAGQTQGSGNKPAEDEPETGDEFGTWLYKLTDAVTFTAAMPPINTGFKPFDEATGDFTIAIRFSRDAQPNNGVFVLLWMQTWFEIAGQNKALALGIYNNADGFQMPKLYFLEACGAFLLDPEGMSITLPDDEDHTIIIARNGTKYYNYIDGILIYGNGLDYVTDGLTSTATLTVGGSGSQNNFIGKVQDVRIYGEYLDTEQCTALYQAMRG